MAKYNVLGIQKRGTDLSYEGQTFKSLDIDTIYDLEFARANYKRWLENNGRKSKFRV